MHVFTDASGKAFGVTVFLVREQGTVRESAIIMAKSCIKPKKLPKNYDKMPKLKLHATRLGIRLLSFVLTQLSLVIGTIHFWVDAKDIIYWLKSPKKQDRFIENRLEQLRKLPVHWIPGKENPADLASRGTTPENLRTSRLWWEGLQWLKESSSAWPSVESYDPDLDMPVPETSPNLHEFSMSVRVKEPTPKTLLDLPRFGFGNLPLAKAVMAIILKFCESNNPTRFEDMDYQHFIEWATKSKIQTSLRDQQKAFLFLIREAQQLNPPSEDAIQSLRMYQQNGIWRCQGRIHHSEATKDAKFPIYLPRRAEITRLIIQHAHIKAKHALPSELITILRQHFWFIKGLKLLQSILENNKETRC